MAKWLQKWCSAEHALERVNAMGGFIYYKRLPGLTLGRLGPTVFFWPCGVSGLMVPIVLVDEVFSQVQVGDVIPDIVFWTIA